MQKAKRYNLKKFLGELTSLVGPANVVYKRNSITAIVPIRKECGEPRYKLKIKIDYKIATPLYLAICGDTSLFRNNNTDSETFDVAGKLLENGAEIRRVYGEFFDKKNVSYIKLSSSVLLGAKINDEYGFVIMSASKEDYEKYNASTDENVGNLANSYLNCGYKIAVVIKEKEDGLHCSLRSKFEYDCSKIAEVFGGGGHKNASGCKIQKDIESAKKDIESQIIKYLRENSEV